MSQSSGDPGGTSVFPKKTRFSVRVANVPTREDLDGEDPAKSAEDELEPLNPGGSGFRLRGISECQEDAAAAEAGHSAYTTQYLKSLRHYLTRDALPNENHYRNILSVNSPKNLRKYSRPTLEELQENDTPKEEPKDAEEGGEKKKGKVVKFGWIEGVFMRCLLNIWGVMLFLRLTWVIGQCGIFQGLLVITVCNVVTFITAISMSAVSTNGMIKGGGIYYMISRSLGPEFGGAIGVMFTIANSIAVATYLVGFCDSLLDMLYEYIDDFEGIIDEGRLNDIRVVGAVTLVAVLALAIVGMDWVTRVQIVLLFLLIGSQIDFFIGSFMPGNKEGKFGFVGYSGEVFNQNLMTTNYHATEEGEQTPSFFAVFGVFFPAVTGIVAGANLSGDLKDPSSAIPKGTLSAIILTYCTYLIYGIMIGCCYLSEASGVEDEYWAAITGNDTIKHFDDCSGRVCIYGSSNDQQTMTKISYTGYLVYAGCFAATISSAIASLVGAPRVLQALARDNLYPGLSYFGKGYGANDDPFRGYILVFIISFGCTMIAKLDIIGTLLSNFFVAAYALINFSVFHATITKSPGWRPSFKYYNPWVALLGTFLCIACMFLMSWITALITLVCVVMLYLYIAYRKPDANWGSSTQGQKFVTALKSVQDLSSSADHVKNYRPKILVFSGNPSDRQPLVDFGNLLTKKLSLLVCGHVHPDTSSNRLIDGLRNSVGTWLKDNSIKGFYSVTADENFAKGATSIMNLTGIGKMSPNMILLGFKSDWYKDTQGLDKYLSVIQHGLDLHLGVAILRLKNGTDYSSAIGSIEKIDRSVHVVNEEETGEVKGKQKKKNKSDAKGPQFVYKGHDGKPLTRALINEIRQFHPSNKKSGFIDVWWLYDDGGLTLLLPYILTTRAQYSDCALRVFALANRKDELVQETRNMASLLAKFRIDYSDVIVIPDVMKKAKDQTKTEFKSILAQSTDVVPEEELKSQMEKSNRHLRIAELLREHSAGSEMVIMTLPMPRKGSTSYALYMCWLDIMTKNMPPFLFVRGNQDSVLTFYS